MPDELGSASVTLTGDSSNLSAAINDAQNRLGGSIFVIRAAGAELSRLGDFALSGFGQAVTAAASFNQELVKSSNLTDLSAQDLNKVHDQLLKIAEATATTPNDVAQGFYYAESVIGDTNKALALTQLAAEGSAIGLGSVTDTTRLLAHVMSVYGLTQDQANHVMNDMVVAAKSGSGQADQFASSLGKILPIAQSAGVSFDDVAAAMAAATRSGLTTSQAATAITRVLQELIAPSQKSAEMMSALGFSSDTTDQAIQSLDVNIGSVKTKIEGMGISADNAQKIMKGFGTSQETAAAEMQKMGLSTDQTNQIISMYSDGVNKTRADLIQYGLNTQDTGKVIKAFNEDQDAAVQRLGMTGVASQQLRTTLSQPGGLFTAMQMIQQATGGNTAELEKLFPNIRALIGVLADASSKGSDYGSILNTMQTDTTSFGAAFNNVQSSLAFKTQDAQVKMQILSIEVGERLAPAVTKLVDRLGPVIDAFSNWIDKNPQLASNLLEIGAGIAVVLSALGWLFSAISGGLAVFRAFAFVIGSLAPVFAAIADFAETVAIVLLYVGDAIGVVVAAVVAFVGLPAELIAAIIALIVVAGLILAFDWGGIRTKIWNALVGLWNDVRPALQAFVNFMKGLPGEIGGAVGGFFSSLGSSIQRLVHSIGAAFSSLGTWVHSGLNAVVNELEALPHQTGLFLGRMLHIFVATLENMPHEAGFILGRTIRIIIGAFEAVVGFFVALPGRIRAGVTAFLNWVYTMEIDAVEAAEGLVTGVRNWLVQLPGMAEQFVIDMYVKSVLWFRNMWNDTTQLTQQLYNSVTNWLSQLPGRAKALVQQMNNNAVSGFHTMLTDTVSTAQNLYNGVISWFQQLPANVGHLASEMGDNAKQKFWDMYNGVTDALNALSDSNTRMWNSILNFISGIGGRLHDMAVNAAKSFVSGFLSGLNPGSPFLPERAMMQITKTVTGEVDKVHAAIRDMNSAVTKFDLPTPGVGGLAGQVTQGETFTTDTIERLLTGCYNELRAIRSGASGVNSTTASTRFA